jgi:hypothetical protein
LDPSVEEEDPAPAIDAAPAANSQNAEDSGQQADESGQRPNTWSAFG